MTSTEINTSSYNNTILIKASVIMTCVTSSINLPRISELTYECEENTESYYSLTSDFDDTERDI